MKGSKVKRVTLERLLRPERRNGFDEDQYYVCATPLCDAVYFGANDGRTFCRSDLVVRFGLKETNAPRPICYCFHHTIEEIHDEIRGTGESTVVERIHADLKNRGCRCEYTNPLGCCCLKSVQAEVADAFRLIQNEVQATTPGMVDHAACCTNLSETHGRADRTGDCCETQSDTSELGSGRNRAGTLAAGGSIVAAILSSACCWLPLVLIAFGASAAGVAGFFEAYRPYFIVGAVGSLGFGFYTVYFSKERCDPDSACAAPNRKLKTFNQVMLWTATTLVGAFVTFPNYVGFVLGSPAQASATVDDTGLGSVGYHIEGMTCEGCATILHSALTALPEVKAVEVDFAKESAVVRYERGKEVPPSGVIEAVKAAGYTATLVGEARQDSLFGERDDGNGARDK